MDKKILLVDDEVEILALLVELLEDEGYQVVQAENGEQAMQLFQIENPDLVITDMRMPKKNGLELLREIKDSGSDVDVIILTGQSDEATAIDCLKAGAYDYLLKPIEDLDLLITAINRALQKRLLELENKRLVRQLEELAIRDSLTGLYNVRQMHICLDDELIRSERHEHQFGLLFLDIDHFKQINDTYGHLFGDYVLKKLGSLMSSTLRSTSKIFRYGGEEFVAILPESDRDESVSAIERLLEAIRQCAFPVEDTSIHITASVGLAVYPEHATDKAELIKLADRALYKAKEGGRDRFIVSSSPQ